MANPETRLQCAVIKYLRTTCPDCVTFHVANGGQRSVKTARLMKALGVLAGVFDLVVLAPGGVCCFLECKADSGRLSPEQTWFKSELIKMGFSYAVIRNLDDLRTFIVQNRLPNRIAEQDARMVVA
jgi:hypothetical protein